MVIKNKYLKQKSLLKIIYKNLNYIIPIFDMFIRYNTIINYGLNVYK